MDKNKLVLPISILVGCIILGGFIYASQVVKQKSIERQQSIDLQAKKEADQKKAEQDQKDYIAERKKDCLAIYKTESDKYNNVRGWRYSEDDDKCFIRYKDPSPKSKAQCDKDYPVGGEYKFIFFLANSLCKDGEFENSF